MTSSHANWDAILKDLRNIEDRFWIDASLPQPDPQRYWDPAVTMPPPPPPPPGVTADEYHDESVRDLPPPGLVRVLTPKATPRRVLSDNDVSLFGDFAPYLDDGKDDNGHLVTINITCPICLVHKLLTDPHSADMGMTADECELIAVLPCGHFAGHCCLEQWTGLALSSLPLPSPAALLIFDNRNGTADPKYCPFCRFRLVYPGCHHTMSPRMYSPGLPRAIQVPLTKPEGGQVPKWCQICFENEVEDAVDHLRHLLFPKHINPADLCWPDSADVLRETSLHFKRRVWEFLAMRGHYMSW